MQRTISLIIQGKVQGVFFRQSTKEFAGQNGITGTVRNEKDGSVRIIATGTSAQLDALTDWCRKGPPRARVDKIDITWMPLENFTGFMIERG